MRLTLIIILLSSASLLSQELNCTVEIQVSPKLVIVDKRIFESLKTAIVEFMNNTKWTKDVYQNTERIECSLLINVNEQISSNEFDASIQVQSRRPVYKSSYPTILLNYNDEKFRFRYLESQQLEFNENTHLSNLTSVLGYYAYIILGLDYDSFAQNGGTPYYQKAQRVMINAQNAPEDGWKSFESNKNRYWLVENLLDKPFVPLREALYNYHRLGLDIMADRPDEGRAVILKTLESLKTLQASRPASFNMQLFFNAKADEVINIFKGAIGSEKVEVISILGLLDPGNNNKYAKINESK